MKKDFFDHMHLVMNENPNVYFLMLGLGYPRVDEFITEYPDRAFNLECGEQAGLDTAVGLAYNGKIPIVYTITPFYYRAGETLRTYFARENLPGIFIGAGRDDDYSKEDGYSHDATDDVAIMNALGITQCYKPETRTNLTHVINHAIKVKLPTYINIKR